MAKRKRKMTLFDVMHTGQPIGLQVRTRQPTYQPTPELPVTKKLAKLFGRTSKPDPNRPLSAAEELEQLRRELGAKRPEPVAERTAEPVEETRPAVEPRVETRAEPRVEPLQSSFRNSERVAAAFAATADPEPHNPRAPRRSFREVLAERWAIASPKLEAMTVHLRNMGGRGFEHARSHGGLVRELYSRYAVTAAAAAGVVILLCGSFYAGKLLFNRPAVNLAGSDATLADASVRPDVLELPGSNARTDASAKPEERTETKLERNAEPAPRAPAVGTVFGGRRTDLNYVIIQSYFNQTEAQATVDVLHKHGIKATVEVNLPRWAMAGKTLYSVVSVDGFTKMTGNAEFQAFMTNLNKISEQEAGSTLPKKLDPRPYRLQPQATP